MLRVVLVYLLVLSAAWADPLLWRVDDPDSGGRAYLFGSIHVGSPAFYPLPEQVQAAYGRSHTLMVEIDSDALEPTDLTARINRLASSERPLRELLSPATWERLVRYSTERGLPLDSLSGYQPWFVAFQLITLEARLAGYQPAWGVDSHFLQQARGVKAIVPLETLEQQLGLFRALSPAEQEMLLLQSLDEADKGRAFLEAMIAAWRDGNGPALQDLILADMGADPLSRKLYRQLFVERNQQMSQGVTRALSRGQQVFVVVGVGHLLGPSSIPELLSARGFAVKQISSFAPVEPH